jgi:hypothetical protein
VAPASQQGRSQEGPGQESLGQEGRTSVLKRVIVALVVVVGVGGLVVAAWLGWRSVQSTSYQQAVASLPEATLRATYTDWGRVRALADGERLGAGSSSREVDGFLSRAYDLDLTSGSAVVDSTYAMNRRYGFSPLDAEWEMFGQSRGGQVVVLRFGESVDLAGVERNLRRLGYEPPTDGAGSGGVWSGSADLVATIDPSLTPVMQYVAVLPEKATVLLSENQAYAASSASVLTGSASGLDEVEGTSSLASAAGSPVSAVLLAADFACEDLSMGTADPEAQAAADRLIAEAGGVSPMAGFVAALQPDRSLVVGMHFENEAQASEDLRARVALATGEAPGQGGTFGERFRVVEATAENNDIVMELEAAEPDLSLLSDLSHGPLLFASC